MATYSYTLLYHANGGSGAPNRQTATSESTSYTFTISSTAPTRGSYIFLGWSKSSSATSATYHADDTVTITYPSTLCTLYAVWADSSYHVSYNKGSSGTGTNTDDIKRYNTTLYLRGALFTRDGYVQSGWATSDGGSQVYALGAAYNENASITLYPAWTADASTISASDGTLGTQLSIFINKLSQSYSHTIKFRYGTTSGIIDEHTANTIVRWTPPTYLANRFPSATSGICILTCETYKNSSTLIGTYSITINLAIPSYIKCSVTAVAFAETVSGLNDKFGAYIQGKSKISITGTISTTNAGGATVSSYDISTNGQIFTDNGAITGVLNTSGANSCSFKITDTRGRTSTLTRSYSVLPYSAPTISAKINRDSSDFTVINVSYSYAISSCNAKNDKALVIKYRELGGNYTTQSVTISAYSGTGTYQITGLDKDTAYEVVVTVTDYFTSVQTSTQVDPVGNLIFDISDVDKTIARHGPNNEDGWDHQYFDERFHGDVDIDGDETVGGALDVSGNATIGGALSVTNRRAAVNSASAGWHRVLEFAPNTATHRLGRAGLIIDFDITRFSTANETHKVSLSLIETNARFMGEESNSNTQLIDKIRYIYDNSKGYVDIHFSSSLSSYVAVDYQVSGCAAGYLAKVHTMNLADVADEPTGETVLTEYALHENGSGDATYNGDVTVGGVLDVTPRRCYATLSSAGWYRVMQYTGSTTGAQWGTGVKIDFAIMTTYNNKNNSQHTISMVGVYHNVAFMNELSYSNETIVDKIRYTYGDGGNGYVDIHYNNSGGNLVYVDFAVHYRQSGQTDFSSVALTPVADSPSGETVLTEYTFGANGTFLQNINGFLNPERITIANGATGNIWFASSSSAYMLMTGINAKCFVLCAARANSSGTIYHGETIIGSGTIGATFATSANTLSITNNSGNELQILILRF